MLDFFYSTYKALLSFLSVVFMILVFVISAAAYVIAIRLLPSYISLADTQLKVLSIAIALLVFIVCFIITVVLFGNISWKIKVERHLSEINDTLDNLSN